MPTPINAPDTRSATAGRAQLLATAAASVPLPAAQRLPALPRLVPMPDAQRTFGPSRATLYRAGAAGEIRLVKVGRGTFLETETVLAWLARLPAITPKPAA